MQNVRLAKFYNLQSQHQSIDFSQRSNWDVFVVCIKMSNLNIFLGCFIILGTCGIQETIADKTPVTFTFKEYQYKDSPKNVGWTRELFLFCTRSVKCSLLFSFMSFLFSVKRTHFILFFYCNLLIVQ